MNHSNSAIEVVHSEWSQQWHDSVKDTVEYKTTDIMLDITMAFGARMRQLGITETELARRIGRSQPWVSKVLNYGNNMTLKSIVMIADALGMDIKAVLWHKRQMKLDKPKAIRSTKSDSLNKTERKNV